MIKLEFESCLNHDSTENIDYEIVHVRVNGKLCKMFIKECYTIDVEGNKHGPWYEIIATNEPVFNHIIHRDSSIIACKKFIFERLRLLDDVECKELE